MLTRIPGLALLALLVLPAAAAPAAPEATGDARVSALYTTWDDYYFYAGIQVRDAHVVATNDTPTSQPQQDDDVEVFFETDNARATVRTPKTFQMAVSAANGSYYSVGAGSKVPKAKAIYSYKYAARVDGTLNENADTDTGYTIELAIPWQQLGFPTGPPKDGATWGFNVISRDRETTAKPGGQFFSLSPAVRTAADVQNPSKWGHITFTGGGRGRTEGAEVVCPQVPVLGGTARYPLVNGSIVSGEWPAVSLASFGGAPIEAPAPTVAQEPNTGDTPFQAPPPMTTNPVRPPTKGPKPPVKGPGPIAQAPPDAIDLPGGFSIRVLPGGSKMPPPSVPSTRAPAIPPAPGGGVFVNPLTPKPRKGHLAPDASPVSLTGSLQLGEARPSPLVMAVYRVDYNADGRKAAQQNVWDASGASLLVDQPINGAGPWFSCLRPQWHRQQLTDLRRAGIDVVLVRGQKNDPLLGRELDALVQALQELKARKLDFPLVGVDLTGSTASADDIYARIPAEFRAFVADARGQNPGLVAYAGAAHDAATLADGTPLTFLADNVAVVSPGRADKSALIGRSGGQTYAQSWQKATDAKAPFVVVDSWNDFSHGTEICGSRQYGEKYADDTRLLSNAFNGGKEWHAKYLSERTPRTIRPKTLYEIPVRLVNAGTLPWRAGEGYALAPRWYKDGRLFDDSSPRIPVGTDVLPGQAVTLGVGLVARNQYGDDLEPGQYTLVYDMVQGQDRWFSYAEDTPLQVPVTVVGAGEPTKTQATFLSAQAPAAGQAGAAYPVRVSVRNDGGAPWSGDLIAYKVQTAPTDGSAVQTLAESAGQPLGAVQPGQVLETDARLTLTDAGGRPLAPGDYRLHWFIKPAGSGGSVAGAYDAPLRVVTSDPGASFILSDVPRAMGPGKEATAKLAVQNLGPDAWAKGTKSVGYHWYYLDGAEAQWDGGALATLPKDVPADGVATVSVKVRAPARPGRYALVWDVRDADGQWASVGPASRGNDLLQVLVDVGARGDVTPVDLGRYAGANGVSGPGGAGDFDGQGRALPAEMLPPDGTAEIDVNPLLLSRPGPPLYPSGFYAQRTGEGWQGNHSVSFLYPASRQGASNVVSCQGQTIDLPGGNYTAVHILAAATGGQPVAAGFALRGGSQPQTITIADWTQTPSGAGATVAFRSPYRIGKNGPEAVPCTLGDYTLTANASGKTTALVLPNNPAVKILAISLEK